MAQAIQIGMGRLANTSNVSGINTFSKTLQDTQRNLLQREETADAAYDDLNQVQENQVVRDVLDNTVSDTYKLVNQRYADNMAIVDDEFQKRLGTTTQFTRGIDGKYKETPEYAKLKTTHENMVQELNDKVVDEYEAGRLELIRNPENYAGRVFRNLLDQGVDPVKAEEIRKQTLEQHKEPDITKRRLFQLENEANNIAATQKAAHAAVDKSTGSTTTTTSTGSKGKGTGYSTKPGQSITKAAADIKAEVSTDPVWSTDNDAGAERVNKILDDTVSKGFEIGGKTIYADPDTVTSVILGAKKGNDDAWLSFDGSFDEAAVRTEIEARTLRAAKENQFKATKGNTSTSTTKPNLDPDRMAKHAEIDRTAAKNYEALGKKARGRETAEEYVARLFDKVKTPRDILDLPKEVKKVIKTDKTVSKDVKKTVKDVEAGKTVSKKKVWDMKAEGKKIEDKMRSLFPMNVKAFEEEQAKKKENPRLEKARKLSDDLRAISGNKEPSLREQQMMSGILDGEKYVKDVRDIMSSSKSVQQKRQLLKDLGLSTAEVQKILK